MNITIGQTIYHVTMKTTELMNTCSWMKHRGHDHVHSQKDAPRRPQNTALKCHKELVRWSRASWALASNFSTWLHYLFALQTPRIRAPQITFTHDPQIQLEGEQTQPASKCLSLGDPTREAPRGMAIHRTTQPYVLHVHAHASTETDSHVQG